MAQRTQHPHGKTGEHGKDRGKEAKEKRPVLSFEREIGERAKHLEERIGKLRAQMDTQKKLLDEKKEELSDIETGEFLDQLEALTKRLLRVAEQTHARVLIPLEEHEELQEELTWASREGSIRGLGKFDEKRQLFIADDEKKTEIDVRAPELGDGQCRLTIDTQNDGIKAIFNYLGGYKLELVYYPDSQKFEVYHTRNAAAVTYEGVYSKPEDLITVFEHFREKAREDQEIRRMRKEMRNEENRMTDINGEEPDKKKKMRSGGIPRSEDGEAQKRKELARQQAIDRSTALKGKGVVLGGTHSLPESLPPQPPLPTGIEDVPVNVDIGDDRRKRYVRRLSVIERGKGARRVAHEVNGNGFYDIGDVGEYNPTTGEAAIHDAHFDLNIAGVPRSSIETSADGDVGVVLASFYDNHYFIELRYDPSEQKCSVSAYFDTTLKQTQTVEEDDKFNRQLPQAVDHAKQLIREEVKRLREPHEASSPMPSTNLRDILRPIDEYIESLDAAERDRIERNRIAEATKNVRWELIIDPDTLRRGALVRSPDGRMGIYSGKGKEKYDFTEESTGLSFSLSERQLKAAKLEQLKDPVRDSVRTLQRDAGDQIQAEVSSFTFRDDERSRKLLERWSERSREESQDLDDLESRLPTYHLSHKDHVLLMGDIERLRELLHRIGQTQDTELRKKFAAAFIFYSDQLDSEVHAFQKLHRIITQADRKLAAGEKTPALKQKAPSAEADSADEIIEARETRFKRGDIVFFRKSAKDEGYVRAHVVNTYFTEVEGDEMIALEDAQGTIIHVRPAGLLQSELPAGEREQEWHHVGRYARIYDGVEVNVGDTIEYVSSKGKVLGGKVIEVQGGRNAGVQVIPLPKHMGFLPIRLFGERLAQAKLVESSMGKQRNDVMLDTRVLSEGVDLHLVCDVHIGDTILVRYHKRDSLERQNWYSVKVLDVVQPPRGEVSLIVTDGIGIESVPYHRLERNLPEGTPPERIQHTLADYPRLAIEDADLAVGQTFRGADGKKYTVLAVSKRQGGAQLQYREKGEEKIKWIRGIYIKELLDGAQLVGEDEDDEKDDVRPRNDVRERGRNVSAAETRQTIKIARREIPGFEQGAHKLPEADHAEVNHLIAELKELLDSDSPSKNVIEAKVERIRSIFKRTVERGAAKNGLAEEAAPQRAKLSEDITTEEARKRLEDMFKPKVAGKNDPHLRPEPFAPEEIEMSDDAIIAEEPSPTPSPEAPETYDTGTYQVIFPPEYMGKPAEVPAELQEIHLRTKMGTVNGRSDYGGPGSKYDKANEDSMFAATTSEGNLIIGVIDGAGGSTNGLAASREANEQILSALSGGASMEEAIDRADASIKQSIKGAYATAVIARISPDGRVVLGWRGDSKAMTIRNGQKVSEGTTELQNLAWGLLNGEEDKKDFYQHPYNNVITGGIGDIGPKGDQTGILEFQARNGDQIVLACDALWDIVSEYEVVELAKVHRGRALEEALYQLVYDRYNSGKDYTIVHAPGVPVLKRAGRGDNITIQVVDIEGIKEKKVPPPESKDAQHEAEVREAALVLLGFLKEADAETFGSINESDVHVVDKEFEGGFNIEGRELFITRSKLYGGERST